MSDRGKITYFRGKLLTEMSREELIAAVEYLGHQFNAQLERSQKERETWVALNRANRDTAQRIAGRIF
jgi:hypothetical protein